MLGVKFWGGRRRHDFACFHIGDMPANTCGYSASYVVLRSLVSEEVVGKTEEGWPTRSAHGSRKVFVEGWVRFRKQEQEAGGDASMSKDAL